MAGARIGSSISLKTKSLWLEIGLSIFVIILALIKVSLDFKNKENKRVMEMEFPPYLEIISAPDGI